MYASHPRTILGRVEGGACGRGVRAGVGGRARGEVIFIPLPPVAHACCVVALDLRARAKVGGSRRSTKGWCELMACCGVVAGGIEKERRVFVYSDLI